MLCINCNKETKNNKFCSRHCSATTNNKLYPKRKPLPTELKRKYVPKIRILKPKPLCLYCRNSIQNTQRTFCNKKCYRQYEFLERVRVVESSGFVYSDTKFNTSASFAKRYLRYKYGDVCSICKISSCWNNQPLTLILDHINGQSNDWSITNLRLVCPNCDSQLPTFKSKNNGNGRPRKG